MPPHAGDARAALRLHVVICGNRECVFEHSGAGWAEEGLWQAD